MNDHPRHRTERYVGRFRGDLAGPSLICVGGLHGNEPAGVLALRRVLERLATLRPPFRGELVGLGGNLAALARRRRFLEFDLNRAWSLERLRSLRPEPGEAVPSDPAARLEDAEQLGLLDALEAALRRARGDVHFLDLHTSSAHGLPFVCIGDTLRNRRFARHFPVPVILGLEEQVDGSLLEFVNNLGAVTVGVEAGQHDLPESVDRHEAFIWLALVAAGNLAADDVPDYAARRALLHRHGRRLPPFLEVRHRHAVESGDGFRMHPGYENFQPVARGEVLARDRRGEIVAPEDGRVLLPLYQGLGSDGFFLVREFQPFWLRLSAMLRRLRLDRVASLLPGVERHPRCPDSLVVDPRVARFLAVELFHLLGFRKRRARGDRLVFTRRRHDLRSPVSPGEPGSRASARG